MYICTLYIEICNLSTHVQFYVLYNVGTQAEKTLMLMNALTITLNFVQFYANFVQFYAIMYHICLYFHDV